MKKTLLLLVLTSGATLAAAASDAPTASPAPPPAQATAAPAASASPNPSFPSQVELVTVDVVVTDKKGAPVTGLTRDDFQVTEEDGPQNVTSFEAVALPATASAVAPPRPHVSTNLDRESHSGRSFVIVFDDIHLSLFNAQKAKAAVAQFLRTGVREGDRVSLVATGGGAWWSTRMEAGRDELIGMLKRLDGRLIPDTSNERMSDWEAMRIHVFHDTQVSDRVARRFDTYGVTQQHQQGGSGQPTQDYGNGDPFVEARASDVYFQSVSRNRISLQILQRVLQALGAARGRKSVILVSEGFIYDPNLDEFKDVLKASRRANAAMYFLDTRGLSAGSIYQTAEFGPALDNQDLGAALMDTLQESEGSESLAADSGGFSVKNTNDLGKGIQRIADESRVYYLLGYMPTNAARDGRFRKIQVRLARKGLNVRARKGYFAPFDGKLVAKKPEPVDPNLQAAVDSPYQETDVPLRATSYVFDETLLGKAAALVATDVDVSKFAFEEKDVCAPEGTPVTTPSPAVACKPAKRFGDTLDFLIFVAHRETGEVYRYDQKVEMKLQSSTREKLKETWFPVVRDFELAPGGYQAKIVVRDHNSGRIGSVIHEFEVPDLQAFRTSTPVLSDILQPDAEKKAVPRPALLVRRNFTPGSTLYASFEVYGAAKEKPTGMPNVTAGYTVRRPDGTPVVEVAPSRITPTSLGKLSRLVGTRLPAEATGDMEFVLSLKDEVSGKVLEVKEPFTVGPVASASAAVSTP